MFKPTGYAMHQEGRDTVVVTKDDKEIGRVTRTVIEHRGSRRGEYAGEHWLLPSPWPQRRYKTGWNAAERFIKIHAELRGG